MIFLHLLKDFCLSYLFFKAPGERPKARMNLEAGLRLEFWRPTLRQPLRRELPVLPFLAWSLFHFLGVFAGRGYALLLIFRGGALVHRTCLLPAHFKFPFMARADLQIAGLWTHPALRGRGLGEFAIQEALRRVGAPGRTLWYMVRMDNAASIRLAQKAGFQLAALGRRRKLLGLQALGSFVVERILISGPEEGPSSGPLAGAP